MRGFEDDACDYETPEAEGVETNDADFFCVEEVVDTSGEISSVSAEAGDGDVTETASQHIPEKDEGSVKSAEILAPEEAKDIAPSESSESGKIESSPDKLDSDSKKEEADLLPPNSKVWLEGIAFRTDDEGHAHLYYDKGEKSWFLLPNQTYLSNGYSYRTGCYGEIRFAEGQLRLSDGDRRPLNAYLNNCEEGDQRGHVIGDRFDASNRLDNVVPQLSEVNQRSYKMLENQLAKAVGEGKEVFFSAHLEYDDPETRRPSAFVIIYTIDGEEHEAVFNNKK